MERAGQVFSGFEVNGCFAADRGIDGRKKTGRNLDKIDSAQVACRRKSGDIADHAAAKRRDKIGTRQMFTRRTL